MTKSQDLFERAIKCIPGGVNSPVRAFGSVSDTPRFMNKADKAYLYDVDGNSYIDYIGSWGPMILGHNRQEIQDAVTKACMDGLSFGAATEKEVEMAELICEIVPAIQMVRMVNSGTEAVMSAIRVARGYTGRNKIIKFAGCYHGHSDSMLVKAGSGVMTSTVPDSAGVPEGCIQDTLTARYNDLTSVETLLEQNSREVAAIIVEPVGANMGVVPPEEGFLAGLRELTARYGALLIFDEVITGFRLGIAGASGYYQVTPDLITFGKIIGAGMPVGAYGGRKEIMQLVSPIGAVYQAGTLSGNPVAMSAGLAQLHILKEQPEIYNRLNESAGFFYTSIEKILIDAEAPCTMNHIGSLGSIFFTKEAVRDYASAKQSDTGEYARYFKYMLNNGIYLAPAQFEAMFLSAAHTRKDMEYTLDTIKQYFSK